MIVSRRGCGRAPPRASSRTSARPARSRPRCAPVGVHADERVVRGVEDQVRARVALGDPRERLAALLVGDRDRDQVGGRDREVLLVDRPRPRPADVLGAEHAAHRRCPGAAARRAWRRCRAGSRYGVGELARPRIGPGVVRGDDALALEGVEVGRGNPRAAAARPIRGRRRCGETGRRSRWRCGSPSKRHMLTRSTCSVAAATSRMPRSRSSNRSFGSACRAVSAVSALLCAARRCSLASSARSALSCSLMSSKTVSTAGSFSQVTSRADARAQNVPPFGCRSSSSTLSARAVALERLGQPLAVRRVRRSSRWWRARWPRHAGRRTSRRSAC